MREEEDERELRVFYELSSMIINILGSPPIPTIFITNFGSPSGRTPPQQATAFASLFIGISLALMMFGSAIFLIGFILMPWVIPLVLLFYFAGIVSSLSDLARAVLCPPPPTPTPNDVAAWKLS